MTEKRFTHKKWYNERQLFDGDEPFAIVDVYIQAEAICDKLNELHDKCEFLEIENESLEDGATRYAELYHKSLKENEQLKELLKDYMEVEIDGIE